MATSNSTRKVYFSVVEDVISNVREEFLDGGVDEQVLQELKQLWESKLSTSKALDPPESEHIPGNIPGNISGNIPFSLMLPQTSHTAVPPPRTIQHQNPVQVQINTDRQISNAASMAFAAQGSLLPHQLQALMNMNPGAQITLQQTVNGQYIVHTLHPGGVTQSQMMNISPQILPTPTGHLQQVQSHNIRQYDGAADDVDDQKSSKSHTEDHHNSKALSVESFDTANGFEFETSTALTKRLERDLAMKHKKCRVPQLDGNHDTSSSEDDYDDEDEANDDDDNDKAADDDAEGVEEEPLNSEDDVAEDDPSEVFDTDNVVVCQFEKISRNKNKWKFILKDGIMNLNGKDHVFQKVNGEADW